MKSRKQYPNNGPSLTLQRLMESPRTNRIAIRTLMRAEKITREETVALLEIH